LILIKECVSAQDITVFQSYGKVFVEWAFEKHTMARILTYSWILFFNVNILWGAVNKFLD